MKVKTKDLTNAALNWAVAKADNCDPIFVYYLNGGSRIYRSKGHQENGYAFFPSTDWAHGGPIIEREKITLAAPTPLDDCWCGMIWPLRASSKGDTALVAAMRCYVTSKLGEEVDVPDELLEVK